MRILKLSYFLVFLVYTSFIQAASIRQTENGPIHEAFLPPVKGLTIEAAPNQPPKSLHEKIPSQKDSSAIWIPGYWLWSSNDQSFIWISGVWRRPPLDHHWVPGYWSQTDQGWIYIPGFWSSNPDQESNFIPIPPPAPLEEQIPPAPGDRYTWISGYWMYDEQLSDYQWVSGSWQPLDPNWVLVPPRYIWRPQGYLFIPAFWDWLIEMRGEVYPNVYVDFTNPLEEVIYEPITVIPSPVIFERLIPFYPDYAYFYHHYYVMHPEFFADFAFVPPWWGWPTWWAFDWHNQWALWWWYTHPGYPQPYWMDAAMSHRLPPPSSHLLKEIKRISPPAIVTKNGVVNSNELIHAMSDRKNKHVIPIIPSNERARAEVFNRLKKEEFKPKAVIEPSGNAERIKQGPPPIPNFKEQTHGKMSQSVKIPPKPTEEGVQRWRSKLGDRKLENPSAVVKPDGEVIKQPQTETRPVQQNQQIRQQILERQRAFQQQQFQHQHLQQQQKLQQQQFLNERRRQMDARYNVPSYSEWERTNAYLGRQHPDLRTASTPSESLYSNPTYYSPTGGLYTAPPSLPYSTRPTGSSSVDKYYSNQPSLSQPYLTPQAGYPYTQPSPSTLYYPNAEGPHTHYQPDQSVDRERMRARR